MMSEVLATKRIRQVTWSFILVLLVWYFLPWIEQRFRMAEPRAVTAWGELAQDERTTIDNFRQSSPSVVFITTS